MRNEKGVTLVEVLVAFVVFLLVSLALMQTALVSIDANMASALREEAVMVAEERLNEARSFPFGALSGHSDAVTLSSDDCPSAAFRASFPTGQKRERTVRSISNFKFCTNMTVVMPTSSTASITVAVGWHWKGQDYRHSISTVRGNY